MFLTSSEKVTLIANAIREFKVGAQHDIARRDMDTFISDLAESFQHTPQVQKHILTVREHIRSIKRAHEIGSIEELEQEREVALSSCKALNCAIAKSENSCGRDL